MKFVLIMMWMGLGSSNVGTIGSVAFENKSACESAVKQFYEAKTGWQGYRAAFCVEDAPPRS